MDNKKGQLRTVRDSATVPSTSAPGIFNHNPNPGIGDPAAKGVIDIKFAESGISPVMKNSMRRPTGVTTLEQVTNNPRSTIDRSKNQTRTMGATKQTGSK